MTRMGQKMMEIQTSLVRPLHIGSRARSPPSSYSVPTAFLEGIYRGSNSNNTVLFSNFRHLSPKKAFWQQGETISINIY